MSIKQQIETDLKQAMLAGDKTLVTTLRGIKSVILNAEVAEGKREQGLDDDAIITLLQKEVKKRQESADLYAQGNSTERQQAELAEKSVIEAYLPAQLSESEITAIVDEVLASLGGVQGMQAMGQVMGAVKAKTGSRADGALVARIVKEKLSA